LGIQRHNFVNDIGSFVNQSKSSFIKNKLIMKTSQPATELLKARLTYQTAPQMDLGAIRRAAGKIDGLLAPSILEQLVERQALPNPQWQHASVYRAIPTALFSQNPKLGVAQLPPTWIEPYLAWSSRLKQARLLAKAIPTMREGKSFDDSREAFQDPLVAAMMLLAFSPAPESDLRQALFDAAFKTPLGAYVCVESLHTEAERAAIVSALSADSLAVFGASRNQGFSDPCLRHAMSRCDLASGLVVARLGTDANLMSWLRSAGLSACENTAAAAAMLVLAPAAPKGLLDLWLNTVRCSNQSADAYTTVYWSRHTWPSPDWLLLKLALKPICIADQKAGWFSWFAHLEGEDGVPSLIQETDALWSFELMHVLNLSPDPLRFRLCSRLGRLTYDWEASLVLSAIEHREQLKRTGELNKSAL
jgi:hypothetical protein